MVRRSQSWDATGFVEKLWERLDPPGRDALAERISKREGKKLDPIALTHRNRGTKPMTPSFAARILAVAPGFTVSDLGAPASVVAAVDPTTADLLRELADKLATTETNLTKLKGRHDRLQGRVRKLEGALRERVGDAPTDLAAESR
jgi:hypothetical protein